MAVFTIKTTLTLQQVVKRLGKQSFEAIHSKGIPDINDSQADSVKSSQGIIDNPFNKESWVKGIAFVPYDTSAESDEQTGDFVFYFPNWPQVSGSTTLQGVDRSFFDEFRGGKRRRDGRPSWGAAYKQMIEGQTKFNGAPTTLLVEALRNDIDVPRYMVARYEKIMEKRFPVFTKVSGRGQQKGAQVFKRNNRLKKTYGVNKKATSIGNKTFNKTNKFL